MKTIYKILLSATLVLFTSNAFSQSDSAIGTWQTESSDKGYLHVAIEECGEMLCGKILNAFDLENEIIADYEHVGKNMVWDMKAAGENKWSKGKIWDPSKDKTYKSKMSLKGDTLSVSGCVLFVCRGQDWARVN